MRQALVSTLLAVFLSPATAWPQPVVNPQVTDVVVAGGAQPFLVSPSVTDDEALRTRLWNYINTGSSSTAQPSGVLADTPFYRQQTGPDWFLFPALPTQSPTAYLNRRLGLPVHGRWVSTYVNSFAVPCIRDGSGCQTSPGAQNRELRPGSIIVKENYPNVNPAITVAQRPTPGVITVMWKPYPGYCGTRLPFNAPPLGDNAPPAAEDCLGGEWLYAFFSLRNPALDSAEKVLSFDLNVTGSNNSQAFCINCHAPAYRADYLRSLLGQERNSVQPGPLQTPAPEPGTPSDFCLGEETLSPRPPSDVPLNPLTVAGPLRQQMFDCFSWRSFIALNWPGSWDDRGQPQNVPFGAFGDAADPAPAVWQTYRATWEVFQPNRGPSWLPPKQFNTPRPAPRGANCPADAAGQLTVRKPLLTQITKTRTSGLNGEVGNETGQAFAGQFGTLADRNGTLVRYEVSMNAEEFNYLVGNTTGLNLALNRNLTPAGPPNFGAVFPNNSIEVKAGWKELCTDYEKCLVVDDASRYFAREVIVYDELTGDCEAEPRLMGLVGLHIIQKTFWAPQWIWATFEQIDNVPLLAGDQVDPEVRQLKETRFNDPSCQENFDFCVFRPFLVGAQFPVDPPSAAACCPNVTLNRFPGFGFFETNPKTGQQIPVPNQLTRLDPIAGSGLNQKFQQLLAKRYPDSPFKYYVLVNTQWPLNGRDATTQQPNPSRCAFDTLQAGIRSEKVGQGCYTLVPEDLRNSVVESYMTDYYNSRRGKPEQLSNRSCLGCHGDAGADFSYIFLDAVEQRVPIQTR